MARIPRMIVKSEEVTYHIISKTALEGFVMGDVEKEYLFNLIKWLSSVFFVEVLGFCIMGNHMHLLIRMKDSDAYSEEEIKQRLILYYNDESRMITDGQTPYWRNKLSNLSEYIKEIKQRFSRYYNKRHNRKGFFWNGRFKSVIVEDGDTLINCLAYIDLNPVRANMVERPEEYRWSSMGYHIQTDNKDGFLSTEFGLTGMGEMTEEERLRFYREFVYENGNIDRQKGKAIDDSIVEEERKKGFELKPTEWLRHRTRYFTDSGIIGTRGFVSHYYGKFRDYFQSKNEKKPKKVKGLGDIYSLKRLSEV